MSSELYVITAATGNIGRKVTEELLAKGKKVRAIGRSLKNLEPLASKGAEAFQANVEYFEEVKRSFANATAVFTLIPPNYGAAYFRSYQIKVAENYTGAIDALKIKYVVNLSSVGAHLKEKNGLIGGLNYSEDRLNKLKDVNMVHVRPSFFMENNLFNIGLIKQNGINGSPLKGDLPVPMIATKDIAAFIADLFINLNFKGNIVRELLGQRDVTMNEVTKILGKTIGKENLQYVQFRYEEAQKAMLGSGFSQDVARLFNEMYRGFNDGVIKPTEIRSSKNTTGTSIEEFAKEFAKIYSAA